ncbi:DNA-processing protein DprA [Acetonema longum]|uniref:DNA-processing protein DprA n=1 Tax=Acetonema longum TaxID=2374 RepID=UPI00145CCB20|nr:DNA-processing protein DprA [Acetonema longum]
MQISYLTMPLKALGSPVYTTKTLALIGNVALLDRTLLAIFASMKSPPEAAQASKTFAGSMPDTISVIAGFHSPLEAEWYRQLRQTNAGLILMPARSLDTLTIRAEWKEMLDAGRMLVISPFAAGYNWQTRDSALQRNRFIAALAEAVLILHAAPGSATEGLAKECLAQDKPVYTLNPDSAGLLAAGARPADPELSRAIGVCCLETEAVSKGSDAR